MLHRLTMVVLEATLCAFKVVQTTRRRLARDYPAMHAGTVDMRKPGEAFCAACPDHEACATGYPCYVTRQASIAHEWRAADR